MNRSTIVEHAYAQSYRGPLTSRLDRTILLRNETPLTEVAGHLPPEAADLLMGYSPEVQMAVLTVLREAICYWENKGIVLDPVAYAAVVTTHVTQAATVTQQLVDALTANAEMARR